MAKSTKSKKKTSAKKTSAKKKSTGVVVNEALARKIIKARANGDSWADIRASLGLERSQINPVRKIMKELDPDSVQASGPRGEGRTKRGKKASAKAEVAENPSKKRTGKKGTKGTKKKKAGGRKKGQRLSLSNLSDSALLEKLIGSEVTFHANEPTKPLVTVDVKKAEMLNESEKFGRLVRVKTRDSKTHTFAVDWIAEIQ